MNQRKNAKIRSIAKINLTKQKEIKKHINSLGCKQDNMSHTHLLLEEYFLKCSLKSLQKNFKTF
jgi:hypothetical protein